MIRLDVLGEGQSDEREAAKYLQRQLREFWVSIALVPFTSRASKHKAHINTASGYIYQATTNKSASPDCR